MVDEIKVETTSTEDVEKQKLSTEDLTKAKKKGGLFGDPVLIIE